jgi:hypothetical protein
MIHGCNGKERAGFKALNELTLFLGGGSCASMMLYSLRAVITGRMIADPTRHPHAYATISQKLQA